MKSMLPFTVVLRNPENGKDETARVYAENYDQAIETGSLYAEVVSGMATKAADFVPVSIQDGFDTPAAS